jgi:hypothetical protein
VVTTGTKPNRSDGTKGEAPVTTTKRGLLCLYGSPGVSGASPYDARKLAPTTDGVPLGVRNRSLRESPTAALAALRDFPLHLHRVPVRYRLRVARPVAVRTGDRLVWMAQVGGRAGRHGPKRRP